MELFKVMMTHTHFVPSKEIICFPDFSIAKLFCYCFFFLFLLLREIIYKNLSLVCYRFKRRKKGFFWPTLKLCAWPKINMFFIYNCGHMPNKAFHMTHRCCSRRAFKTVPVKLGPKTFQETSRKMVKTFHLLFLFFSFEHLQRLQVQHAWRMPGFFLSCWDGLKTTLKHEETAATTDCRWGVFLHRL